MHESPKIWILDRAVDYFSDKPSARVAAWWMPLMGLAPSKFSVLEYGWLMNEHLTTAIITLVSGIIGGVVTHWLALLQQKTTKLREIQIDYLINAYRQLERNSNSPHRQRDESQLEAAIADIQLLGTKRQSELAQQFATNLASKGGASLDELLADLRDTLRSELKLQTVPKSMKYLRFTN